MAGDKGAVVLTVIVGRAATTGLTATAASKSVISVATCPCADGGKAAGLPVMLAQSAAATASPQTTS